MDFEKSHSLDTSLVLVLAEQSVVVKVAAVVVVQESRYSVFAVW